MTLESEAKEDSASLQDEESQFELLASLMVESWR